MGTSSCLIILSLSTVPRQLNRSLPPISIGVLQSLADHDPDVDAIYRLVRSTPFSFDREGGEQGRREAIVLPKGRYSPYNAQATLHYKVY